jgi:uncharacterized protein
MLIGREKELGIFKRLLQSKKAEFLAIYGRRRIGKTYLVNQFFKDKGIYFTITGSKKASKKKQLKNFHDEFLAIFGDNYNHTLAPSDWSDAFQRMQKTLKSLNTSKKIILFFDELPWLATPRSDFLSALEYIWNQHLSRMDNVILVICGSAAAWMIKKVIHDKGGLHGRLSAQIALQPFHLNEIEKLLFSQNVNLNRKQILNLYMAFGGVAKYLTYIPPGLSSSQIINELCFSPTGSLFLELSHLYGSLFDNPENHIKIIKALAKKRDGIDQKTLLEQVDLKYGGFSTSILNELEESGFITSVPEIRKSKKLRKYRLIDEYSYFYLTWIEKVKSQILR